MITKVMKICDILDLSDDYEKIFEKHGLPCLGCPGALSESLEEAAKGHDIDLEALLSDLNKE